MSCDTDHETLLVKERSGYAVVLTPSKARSHHTSCVICLKLHRDKEQNYVKGNPFKLLPKSGRIWRNIDLRKAGIQEGSIIVVDQNGKFVNNTKEKMVSFYDCMTIVSESIWYGSFSLVRQKRYVRQSRSVELLSNLTLGSTHGAPSESDVAPVSLQIES